MGFDHMHALVLENVSKSFGGINAVSKVNLTVTVGESRALIGPNGAGKSTLFNLVTGEIPLDRGRILIFGKDLTREPIQKRIASQLGRTYQISNLFTQLTVQENLFLASWQTRKMKTSLIATLFRSWKKFGNQRRHVANIARRVGLDDKLDVTVNELSHGANRQLELGITLAHEPRILLLDEPTSALSRENTEQLFSVIARLRDRGVSVIYISHFLEEVKQVADRYTVLRDGRSVDSGIATARSTEYLIEQMVGRELEQLYPADIPMKKQPKRNCFVMFLKREMHGLIQEIYSEISDVIMLNLLIVLEILFAGRDIIFQLQR